MAPDLRATQAFLIDAILGSEPIPSHPTLAARTPAFVRGNERVSPTQQADIYRRLYWLRHREVLRDDLLGLVHLLGDEPMDAMLRAYLDAHPPAEFSFVPMVQRIPSFLESYAGIDPEKRQIVLDMARYEVALLEHRFGREAPPLDPQKLAGLPEDAWEKARLVLHPMLRLFSFAYPVHRIRRSWVRNEEVTLPDAPSAEPIFVALYRTREIVTHFEELAPEAFAVLVALSEGLPLVPALDRVAQALSAEKQAFVMSNVGTWFQAWTARGFVVDVELP